MLLVVGAVALVVRSRKLAPLWGQVRTMWSGDRDRDVDWRSAQGMSLDMGVLTRRVQDVDLVV